MIELHITDTGSIKTIYYTSRGVVASNVVYQSEDNLPDDVKVKLAVLKMMQDYTDIPDIGQRVTSEVYWIYEGGNTAHEKLYAIINNMTTKLKMKANKGFP